MNWVLDADIRAFFDSISHAWMMRFIVGFERQADAGRFLRDPRERLAKFGLALHPDKTRLMHLGWVGLFGRR